MRLIISGATRGIGRAIAKKFASHGFNVAFCGTNPVAVAEFETFLKNEYAITAYGIVADLSVKTQAEHFARTAKTFLGGCDVLINNAGMYAPGTIETEPDGLFEKQMAVNLNSAYYLTQALIPDIRNGKRRHIFNMCSIASITAYPNGSSYCISKFALLGLTKVLRQELMADGICVTAVMPGATFTESWGNTDLPPTRFITTDNIAETIYSAWSLNENAVLEEIVIRPIFGDI